jgi:aldose 1-epimerase
VGERVRRLVSADGAIEVAVLPEIGARLHRLRAFGVDLLRTPADPATHRVEPIFWGAYAMAPWCNRLEPGTVRVSGRTVAVEPNFGDGSAIHGQVFAAAWREGDEGEFAVTAGGDWWPWPYDVVCRIVPADGSLRMDLRLTNLGDEAMPAGLGLHPWFSRPVEVAIRADAVYPSNLAHVPSPEPVAGPFDRRSLAELPIGLDATWTALQDPPITFRWPKSGIRATLTFEAPARCVAAASPEDLDAIAIEPETHAPYGLRRLLENEPDALQLLDPGASMALSMALRFDQEADSTRIAARNV